MEGQLQVVSAGLVKFLQFAVGKTDRVAEVIGFKTKAAPKCCDTYEV